MAKGWNKDGSPRKRRTDCGFYRLPEQGQQEFMAIVHEDRANPDMKRLCAVVSKHKQEWSMPRIYDFLRSPRCQEELIAHQVRLHRAMGETMASAGADHLHADARRLAIAHWTTILANAQVLYSDPQATSEQKAAAYVSTAEATDKLVALGALKAGEDKGALALAKLELDKQKVSQSERKVALLEAKMKDALQVADAPKLSAAEKTRKMREILGMQA